MMEQMFKQYIWNFKIMLYQNICLTDDREYQKLFQTFVILPSFYVRTLIQISYSVFNLINHFNIIMKQTSLGIIDENHQFETPLNQQEGFKYAIHMHPMTNLRAPDLIDHDRNSMFDIACEIMYSALPLILCFELNIFCITTNIYLVGNHQDDINLAGICLGTVFANVFGFMVIQNISLGYSVVSSYFINKQERGFMYQKTLGINFVICIMATTILYLGNKALYGLNLDQKIIEISGEYIWALIPTFYLYSFFDSTRNYLQTEGVIFPTLIIQSFVSALHFVIAYLFVFKLELGVVGVAWATNLSNILNALILYLYIVKYQPTKQSWIEWNIKATNNIHRFFLVIVTHQVFVYFEVLPFQLMGILACFLTDLADICAYFALAITLSVLFNAFLGLSHCLNKSLSQTIFQHNQKIAKKKIFMGLAITSIASGVIVGNLYIHSQWFFYFLHDSQTVGIIMSSNFFLFCVIVLLQAHHVILMGIIKILQDKQIWKGIMLSSYIVGIGGAWIFTIEFQWGVQGILFGWMLHLILSISLQVYFLAKTKLSEHFIIVQQKYKIITEQVRASKIDLTSSAEEMSVKRF